MTESKWARMSLLALCTLVSAPAQTPVISSGLASIGTGKNLVVRSSEIRNRCSAALMESEGGGSDLSNDAANISSTHSLSRCTDPRQLTIQFADERLAVWRKHLKLEDWQISVVMTRRSDLKPKTRGHIRWDKGKKSAVICVLDASDYQLPLLEMLDDMEFTIVHELVHLELASLPRSEASRSSEEHAVNRLTEALLMLDRQK